MQQLDIESGCAGFAEQIAVHEAIETSRLAPASRMMSLQVYWSTDRTLLSCADAKLTPMAVHIRIEAVVIPVSEIGIAGLPLLLVGSPKNPTTSIGASLAQDRKRRHQQW